MNSALVKEIRAARKRGGSSGAGGGGCDRCRGLLITIRNATTGTLDSARWNGKLISEDELIERQQETECPRCGRKIDPNEGTQVNIGGGTPAQAELG